MIDFSHNRKVKHHVYVKRQTRICTTWPSFLFTYRLLFIISTHKLAASRNFLCKRIVLSCFYLLIFYIEKFSTWIWLLTFAIYVKLKFSPNNAREKIIKKPKWSRKGNALIFYQILPTNSLRKVWRPVSRICMRIVECMHVHSAFHLWLVLPMETATNLWRGRSSWYFLRTFWI